MKLSEATDRVIGSFPPLANTLSNLNEEWRPQYPPATLLYAAFGQAIATLAVQLNDLEKTRILDCIEELLSQGDESVKAAVATGLIESLLSESSANRFDFRIISDYLGLRTKQHCLDWDRFTGCATPGL